MKTILPSPTREVIAVRAYQLWEEAGRQAGRDEEFWLRAEKQLQHRDLPSVVVLAPPPVLKSSACAVPPIIREVVRPVARPPTPALSRKRRAR